MPSWPISWTSVERKSAFAWPSAHAPAPYSAFRQGILTIVTGIALGAGASLVLTRAIESLLWGVTPTDPLTFTVVLATVSLIGLLACYVPARRASRIDPLVTLRDP